LFFVETTLRDSDLNTLARFGLEGLAALKSHDGKSHVQTVGSDLAECYMMGVGWVGLSHFDNWTKSGSVSCCASLTDDIYTCRESPRSPVHSPKHVQSNLAEGEHNYLEKASLGGEFRYGFARLFSGRLKARQPRSTSVNGKFLSGQEI